MTGPPERQLGFLERIDADLQRSARRAAALADRFAYGAPLPPEAPQEIQAGPQPERRRRRRVIVVVDDE
jgi:hypothetical protein